MKFNWKLIISVVIIFVISKIYMDYSIIERNKLYYEFEKRQLQKLNINVDSLLTHQSIEEIGLKMEENFSGEVKLLYKDSFNHNYGTLIAFNNRQGYKIICYYVSSLYPYIGDSIICSEGYHCYLKKKTDTIPPTLPNDN